MGMKRYPKNVLGLVENATVDWATSPKALPYSCFWHAYVAHAVELCLVDLLRLPKIQVPHARGYGVDGR